MTNPPRSVRAPRVGGIGRPVPRQTAHEQGAGRGAEREQAPGTAARISLGRVFQAESANYFMLLGITLFMVVFGLVMVLSSSSVESHTDTDNFFSRFWSQGIYALVGLPLMLLVSRLPTAFWKKTVWVFLGLACLLQLLVLVTPLGVEIGGNRNWLRIGGFAGQPSEAIKVALVVWLGVVLARKRDLLDNWKHLLIPVVPVAGGAILLVIMGGDLGTTVIMAGIVLGALFFAGVKIRHLAVGSLVISGLALLIAFSSKSRVGRIMAFFGGHSAANPDVTWQINNGFYALASGGVFGVGLGNSHSKWSWLPAADTDFIFAIIGEELGLIGAIVVLVLFVLLAITFLRIIHASSDPFAKITTAAILVWLIAQAFVNIGVVLGVIPVLGVPLPLISAGGTAMISSMIAIGIVLSFARETSRENERAARGISSRA
ncbi:putative lipid II flippase FtsW [Diaminobutyricibacter sp. McL0608]|uniref:putative lipid II flippase FtsW n=1 Tax=Leifsonia sp. McL0608 TaxID=3143537 RepID=UPI0031F31AF4